MFFNSLKPERIQQRKRVHEICRQFSRSPSKGNLKRLKSLFNQVGEGVFIEYGFHCDYGNKISIGDNVYININCTFLDGGYISIGNDCLIAPNVQLLTINHALSPTQRLKKESFIGDITIADNVWLGAGVIVLANIKIDSGAVVGAGSVVTQDIASNGLYLGNPAKKIRDL